MQPPQIFSGEAAFFLVDTKGLPINMLHDLLKEHKLILDCVGFFKAAHKAGWTLKKTVSKLTEDMEIPKEAKCNVPLQQLHPEQVLEWLGQRVYDRMRSMEI